MNFAWFLSLILALIAAVAAQNCPSNFKLENKLCTAERPIHGECPPLSVYSVNINKCVYAARG